MIVYSTVIASIVAWLRRPADLVATAKAFLQTHGITSVEALEHTLSRLGIPIITKDLDPTIDGLATQYNGETLIVMQPNLNPLHREFTLAHELGHTQLHLQNERRATESTISNPRIGDIEDVEADCFLFIYLTQCLHERDLPKYVLANPKMILRVWRILWYFRCYKLRVHLANVLKRVFLDTTTKGAA